jgi:hypothetical protein
VDGEEKDEVKAVSIDEEARQDIVKWLELIESAEEAIQIAGCESLDTGKTCSLTPNAAMNDSNAVQDDSVDIFDEYGKFDKLHITELFRSLGIMVSPNHPPKK